MPHPITLPQGSQRNGGNGATDGAGNEGAELMSSLVIEFVPAAQPATPTT
jgi:hypothetical protein